MSDNRSTYLFRRRDNDEIVVLSLTLAELFERQDILGRIVLDDGTEAQRVYSRSERLRRRTKNVDPWRGHASEAAAVDPRDIPEAVEHARRSGVPTDFDSEGRPRFKSLRHQTRYLRAIGMHNHDGIH